MEFGKVNSKDIKAESVFMPITHNGSLNVLGKNKAKKPNLFIGCPIWSNEGFLGRIYPIHTKPRNYPLYYGKQFNTIELNISHYKFLDKMQVQSWHDVMPKDFKFSPKVHQSISHTPFIKQNADLMLAFLENMKHFNQKLGLPFLQLPESYNSSKINDLLFFLDTVSSGNFALELRHYSWFNDEKIVKYISNYCYSNNITLVINDTLGRRDVLHQRLTTKKAFIRFLANDMHPTDYKRIDYWAITINEWIDNGLEELYFYVHTTTQSMMPDIITYMIKKIYVETCIKIIPPTIIGQNNIKDITLFDDHS